MQHHYENWGNDYLRNIHWKCGAGGTADTGPRTKTEGQAAEFSEAPAGQRRRIIVGAVLSLLMIITWIVNNPASQSGSSPSDWKSELSAADLKNTMNNGETKGAPQQTVVNGWYANNIAAVTAAQNAYIATSPPGTGIF